MAYFVFCSKMESGYLCYYCNEKFDLFKDIFNHLIEKHKVIFGTITVSFPVHSKGVDIILRFLYFGFSVSHPVSTQNPCDMERAMSYYVYHIQ